MNEQERDTFVLICERCGEPAKVDWVDVSTPGAPNTYMVGETRCTTRGCYDEDGSRRVPLPPQPGELTRADRAWLRYHQRLATR